MVCSRTALCSSDQIFPNRALTSRRQNGENGSHAHMLKKLDLRKYDHEFRDMAVRILEANGFSCFKHGTYKTHKLDRTMEKNGQKHLLHFLYYGLVEGNIKLIHNAAHHLHNVMAKHNITYGTLVFSAKRPLGFPDYYSFPDGRRIDYVGLLDLKRLIKEDGLRRDFESWLNGSAIQIVDDRIVPIESLLHFDPSKPPTEGVALIAKLEACKPGGSQQSEEFEDLCVEAVDLLFGEQFSQKTRQYVFKHKRRKIDYLVTLNDRRVDGFWLNLRQDFRSRSVVFEFKNSVHQIGPRDIDSTGHYLFPNALRSVAIIFSRKGPNRGARSEMLEVLHQQGKLILALDLGKIRTMLLKFDKGEQPSDVLTDELDRMLEKINQHGGIPHLTW